MCIRDRLEHHRHVIGVGVEIDDEVLTGGGAARVDECLLGSHADILHALDGHRGERGHVGGGHAHDAREMRLAGDGLSLIHI